ncbi:MAG: hypothetical protein ACXWN2_10990 [Candidatus Limnocylindrales bacterium]
MTARHPARLALRSLPAALLGATLAWALVGQAALAAPAASATQASAGQLVTAAALPRWTGGMDLYRSGAYAVQGTWYWCTAANAQIMRNLKYGATDHSTATQQRYFDYMRAHDRYAFPVGDGSDPQGWALGIAHYVDGRYRLLTYGSFDAALRAAVTRLRQTQLPVSLAVMRGAHAWVLHGFTATADPAMTSHFTVTSVRVTGPLWGKAGNTYDMAPDTSLSTAAFRSYFTPFHYGRVHMVWEGRYVTIQPVPRAAAPASAPKPKAPAPAPTPAPPPAFVPRLSLVLQPHQVRI